MIRSWLFAALLALLTPLPAAEHPIQPGASPQTVLDAAAAGDRLVFTGVVSSIVDLEKIPGLVPAVDPEYQVAPQAQRKRSRRSSLKPGRRSSSHHAIVHNIGQKMRKPVA